MARRRRRAGVRLNLLRRGALDVPRRRSREYERPKLLAPADLPSAYSASDCRSSVTSSFPRRKAGPRGQGEEAGASSTEEDIRGRRGSADLQDPTIAVHPAYHRQIARIWEQMVLERRVGPPSPKTRPRQARILKRVSRPLPPADKRRPVVTDLQRPTTRLSREREPESVQKRVTLNDQLRSVSPRGQRSYGQSRRMMSTAHRPGPISRPSPPAPATGPRPEGPMPRTSLRNP
jgi:hypothetical protein